MADITPIELPPTVTRLYGGMVTCGTCQQEMYIESIIAEANCINCTALLALSEIPVIVQESEESLADGIEDIVGEEIIADPEGEVKEIVGEE